MFFSNSITAAAATTAESGNNAAGLSNERLFIVNPRSITSPSTDGDRGYRAYIRLMTSSNVNISDTSTYASAITGSGGSLDQAVNGSSAYGGYASFLLTGVQAGLNEKVQVTETFGDNEVYYYFGRQPMTFSFSGVLIDSVENDWLTQWLYMYSQVMRGTSLAKNYQLLKIVLPNMTLIGTMAGMNFSQSSERDTDIPFSFQFLVKRLIPTPVNLMGTAFSPDASSINFNSGNDFLSQSGINTVKSSLSSYYDTIQSATSSVSSVASSLVGLGSGLTGSVSAATFGAATSSSTGTVTATGAVSSSDAFYGITATLAGARASLFSPAYGVLSSLTKLISSSSSNVSSVFNSVLSPVNSVLRDIKSISTQATGIVNLVKGSVLNLAGQVVTTERSFLATVGSIENTVGSITTAPQSLFSYIQGMVGTGKLSSGTPFLQNKSIGSLSISKSSLNKIALLNSGTIYTPAKGAYL